MAKGVREFHYVRGTSSKFWRIRQDGAAFTVWFGRIGSTGVEQVKRFSSPALATKAAEQLIAEKKGKGYTEKSPRAKAAEPRKTTKQRKTAKPRKTTTGKQSSAPKSA